MADLVPITSLTLENYYELEAAVFSGAQTVSYSHPGGNKSVSYRSIDDMLKLLRLLGVRLGIIQAGGRRTYAQFSKGYQRPDCGNREEGGECLGRFDTDGRCCP